MSNQRGTWYSLGDINAFFGLSLDNIAGLVMVVGIMVGQFGVPTDFAMRYLVPGTAIGVLVGDLLYFVLAIALAMRTRNWGVTAMPLGLDTPSVFGMSYFVLGPAFLFGKSQGMDPQQAAIYMWEIGIGCVFMGGIFKLICAFSSRWAQRCFPRAGLLGSLASVALVIISFLPLLDVLEMPIVGLIALSIVLTSLVGGVPLPGRTPGVLGALVIAGGMFYGMQWMGLHLYPVESPAESVAVFLPGEWLQAFQWGWVGRLDEAARYLPIVLPLALATVIGGIDCSESAAAAGDRYSTGWIVGIEALATLVAAMCGGVVQTTPYIGHPAYKAMGGRSAYTLATALFIGAAGTVGFFGYFYQYVPPAAVFPILIFVGLEITSQSFLATPRRHYPAVALSCVPALAFLSVYFANQVLVDPHVRIEAKPPQVIASPSDLPNASSGEVAGETTSPTPGLANQKLSRQMVLANCLSRGFIVTSLLWASTLAMAIDRRLFAAAAFSMLAGVLTLFGVIHSPLPSGALYLPFPLPGLPPEWTLPGTHQALIFHWSLAYLMTGGLLLGWGYYLRRLGLYGVPLERHAHDDSSQTESH